jgi:hypothetical protein
VSWSTLLPTSNTLFTYASTCSTIGNLRVGRCSQLHAAGLTPDEQLPLPQHSGGLLTAAARDSGADTMHRQSLTSMPGHSCDSSFLATAPAATRPMVSRAEDRPPPATARMPYLKSYVASAWLGLYATSICSQLRMA